MSKLGHYVKQGSVVEALLWDGSHEAKLAVRQHVHVPIDERGGRLSIENYGQWSEVPIGMWLVNADGRYGVVGAEDFALNYVAYACCGKDHDPEDEGIKLAAKRIWQWHPTKPGPAGPVPVTPSEIAAVIADSMNFC